MLGFELPQPDGAQRPVDLRVGPAGALLRFRQTVQGLLEPVGPGRAGRPGAGGS